MAVAKRKKVKKYKFELTRGAISGIGIICFCIFLWMFLFGVWTGQSLLQPSFLDSDMNTGEQKQIVDLSDQKKRKPE